MLKTKTFKYILLLLLCYCEIKAEKKACSKLPNVAEPPTLSTLRKRLICKYDVEKPPTNATNTRVGVKIYMGMDSHRLEFSGNSELLLSFSYLQLVWQDDRLKWKESDFKNHSYVYMRTNDIWIPIVTALGHGHFKDVRYVQVESNGEVSLVLWWEIAGRCKPSYEKWTDKRICTIAFQLEPAEKLYLVEEFLPTNFSDKAETWGVFHVKKEEGAGLKSSNVTDAALARSKLDGNFGLISFEIHLLRNTAVMEASILPPATVLFLLLLVSTWIPCRESIRLAVLALTTLLEIYLMHFATLAIPTLPGRFSDFATLYRDMVLVSGAAFFEWYVSYLVASKKVLAPVRSQFLTGVASQSSYAFFRSILLIPSNPPKVEHGSAEGAFLSVILDRITFVILSIAFISFVITTAHRPILL